MHGGTVGTFDSSSDDSVNVRRSVSWLRPTGGVGCPAGSRPVRVPAHVRTAMITGQQVRLTTTGQQGTVIAVGLDGKLTVQVSGAIVIADRKHTRP